MSDLFLAFAKMPLFGAPRIGPFSAIDNSGSLHPSPTLVAPEPADSVDNPSMGAQSNFGSGLSSFQRGSISWTSTNAGFNVNLPPAPSPLPGAPEPSSQANVRVRQRLPDADNEALPATRVRTAEPERSATAPATAESYTAANAACAELITEMDQARQVLEFSRRQRALAQTSRATAAAGGNVATRSDMSGAHHSVQATRAGAQRAVHADNQIRGVHVLGEVLVFFIGVAAST